MADSSDITGRPGSVQITIYVGNLTMVTTEADLRQVFEPFGQVMDVKILNDDYPGNTHPKAHAFVGMSAKNAGEAAIAELDGKLVGGQIVNVIGALRLSPPRHPLSTRRGARRPGG
jgi:RNA recognition motif-containing protein